MHRLFRRGFLYQQATAVVLEATLLAFAAARGTSTPAINIGGEWLQEAGVSTGQPLKLRVMPGCIVINMQDIRGLWRCLEGFSREPFNERAAADWLNRFPSGLDMAGIADNN
ncbi:SymE family type I addiction module toxin [Brenneria goodwinii]|uniref:SymE family type I addiction module toxin n=1 Tax=Brenneria goodwinii TaxID=1109412 RepID=UPI0036F0C3B6